MGIPLLEWRYFVRQFGSTNYIQHGHTLCGKYSHFVCFGITNDIYWTLCVFIVLVNYVFLFHT